MTHSFFQENPVTIDLNLEGNILKVVTNLPILSSKGANWHGIRAAYCLEPAYETPDFLLKEHTIHIHARQPSRVQFKTENERFQEAFLKGHVGISPANHTQKVRYQGDTESIHLYLDPIFMQQVVSEYTKGTPIEILPQVEINDPLIRSLGISLISELKFNKERSRLYAETAAALLSVHLFQHYSAWKQVVKQCREGLSQSNRQQVLDYINSYLDQNLNLTELAALVNISPYYFARLFKQSMGMAPHQYVTKCRIKKAIQLLTRQELSILEISQQIGFQSQSHFTTLFRRFIGVTPTTYRNSL